MKNTQHPIFKDKISAARSWLFAQSFFLATGTQRHIHVLNDAMCVRHKSTYCSKEERWVQLVGVATKGRQAKHVSKLTTKPPQATARSYLVMVGSDEPQLQVQVIIPLFHTNEVEDVVVLHAIHTVDLILILPGKLVLEPKEHRKVS